MAFGDVSGNTFAEVIQRVIAGFLSLAVIVADLFRFRNSKRPITDILLTMIVPA